MGSQTHVVGILDEDLDPGPKDLLQRGASLDELSESALDDEPKATSTKSVFQHLAQPARVAAEFELASAEFLETLLVVPSDLGPPLLGQELVEESSDLLLFGSERCRISSTKRWNCMVGISIEHRSLDFRGDCKAFHSGGPRDYGKAQACDTRRAAA